MPRSERRTQNRVSAPFTDPARPVGLGCRYLGEWSTREGNCRLEATLLRESLAARRDKIRDLKQAMMQELLTGRTRLV